MNAFPDRATDFLEHIDTAINRILKYTDIEKAEFISNELIQDAVIRNLEVIGEASRNIEKHFPEFAEKYPDFPLRNAYRMRNFLSHGYFLIDFEVVWSTVQVNLPELKSKIERIRIELASD